MGWGGGRKAENGEHKELLPNRMHSILSVNILRYPGFITHPFDFTLEHHLIVFAQCSRFFV